MKHGSLFSGIGGFDLAAEWMGWENVFHCEWNPFGQKVLKHYWPKAESFNDITQSDFTKYANTIDILTGGFPCQPYSAAGKRLGKEDERHLWPHMLRAIQEISPRYIVGENVRGLLNWNGGLVFDEVCADLENNGYQVAPVLIPACGVNAPHRRERIWFVATNTKFKSTRSDRGTNNEEKGNVWRENTGDVFGTLCGDRFATNTNNTRANNNFGIDTKWQKENKKWNRQSQFKYRSHGGNGYVADTTSTGPQTGTKSKPKQHWENGKTGGIFGWQNFPTEPPVCGGDDGISTELDGIAFSKWRNESIKALGNAIVPQVAFEIFKAIQQCDDAML